MFRPLFALSERAQEDTVFAVTTVKCAVLVCVRLFSVGSATHFGVGHDCLRQFSGLCSLGRRWVSQSLWWRLRLLTALLWSLFARLAWAQPAIVVASMTVRVILWPLIVLLASDQTGTVVVDTTGEGDVLASVRLVGVGSAQEATEVAGTTAEGALLASILSFGVGSASHCAGGHDRSGRCPGLCSLGRRGLSQPLFWRARQVRALLWPLFAQSAWSEAVIVVAGTKRGGVELASDR
jgi:hypothetical protein